MIASDDEMARLLASDARASADPDPLRQSGFLGDNEAWEAQRRPMLDAVDRSGTFLDVGCASGYLLECLVHWARQRGFSLDPFGLDIGPRLIELATRRLPQWADRFFVGDTREWTPPRRFDLVCTSLLPDGHGDRRPHLDLLISRYVVPDGRLILRSYFTPTGTDVWNSYFDNAEFLREHGLQSCGSSASVLPRAEYVWIDL